MQFRFSSSSRPSFRSSIGNQNSSPKILVPSNQKTSYPQNSDSLFHDRRHISFLVKWWLDIDKINFLLIAIIMVFGLMITFTSSQVVAKKIDVEKFFFLKKQLIFAALSMFTLISLSFLDEEKAKKFSLIGLFFSIAFLISVLLFGSSIKGATRWISIFGINIQPSEFVKTFFIVSNSLLLQHLHRKKILLKYGISAALFTIIATLLICQPDFGMTISLTVIWVFQLVLNGLPWIIITILGIIFMVCGIVAYVSLPHVEDRINRFLDSDQHNYQAERAIDAFLNGSFFGVGPGNGSVKKFIPDVHTDFIFSVIGEEYGIFTCSIVILIFALLVSRIVRRALQEKDLFVYLALSGLMLQFTMQVIVNVGVSLKLLPTKGMTLPFISYGGSSMISTAICFGLILAFTKRRYHSEVDYGNIKMI